MALGVLNLSSCEKFESISYLVGIWDLTEIEMN